MKSIKLSAITLIASLASLIGVSAVSATEVPRVLNNPGLQNLQQLQGVTGINILGDRNNLQILQQQAGDGGSNNGVQRIYGGSGYTAVPRIPALNNSFNPASTSNSTATIPITNSLNPAANLNLHNALNPAATLNVRDSLNPQATSALTLTNSLNPSSRSYAGSSSNTVVIPTTTSSANSNPYVFVGPTNATVYGSGNSWSQSDVYNRR